MEDVLRPGYARPLTAFIVVVAVVGVAAVAVGEGVTAALRLAPWPALLALACWACFWRPAVVVSDGGVRLVNVTRTIDVPWPALQAVDTHWALTLITAYGRYTAWAAPAPGTHATVRFLRSGGAHDSEHAAIPPALRPADAADEARPAEVRPGDLATVPSGAAAACIRERWDRLRAAGHLDDPRLERDRVPVTWHVGTLAACAGLAVLGVVTTI